MKDLHKFELTFTEKDLKEALEQYFDLPKGSIGFCSCVPIFNKHYNILTYWK